MRRKGKRNKQRQAFRKLQTLHRVEYVKFYRFDISNEKRLSDGMDFAWNAIERKSCDCSVANVTTGFGVTTSIYIWIESQVNPRLRSARAAKPTGKVRISSWPEQQSILAIQSRTQNDRAILMNSWFVGRTPFFISLSSFSWDFLPAIAVMFIHACNSFSHREQDSAHS